MAEEAEKKPNQRVRDGVVETQVGPVWIELEKARLFRRKVFFDELEQRYVLTKLIDGYLEGRFEVPKK